MVAIGRGGAVHRLLGRPLLALCVGPVIAVAQPPAPDLVLTDGRVFTADSTHPWAEALAIRGDRIIAVGSTAEVRRLVGPTTRHVALGGRVVIPGVNDAHTHLGFAPAAGVLMAPRGWPGPGTVLDSLAALARQTPPGTWLRADLGMPLVANPAFRRDALDRVAPRHPVALVAQWGHVTLLNTRGLRAAGIAEDARDPLGGWLEREPAPPGRAGRLSGLVEEYAQFPVWDAVWRAYDASGALLPALRREAADAARLGVTSIQDMASPLVDARTAARVFRGAALPQRVRLLAMVGTGPAGRRPAPWRALPERIAPRVRRHGVKYLLDGTPLEGNAVTRQPYAGLRLRPAPWHGRLSFPPDTVRAILREALASREPLALHAAGDSTVRVVLDAMEAVAPDSAWRPLRVRIEHAPGLLWADIARAARKGVVIAQPRADRLRTWQTAGLVVAFGSDASGEPWRDFQRFVVAPDDTTEAVTRERAVLMMTRDAAYAEFAEREKGTLAPGMLADVAVLSQDVFTVPAAALPDTRSVLTVVGGRVVYAAPGLAPKSTPRFEAP